VSDPDAVRANPRIEPDGRGASQSTVEEVLRREDARQILSALAKLRPEAREMFRLLAEEDLGRKGLLEHYDLNKNTLDTRLHAFRKELRKLLADRGVAV
jgi:DNA-directed RNA polymerase specialized sigma24 family protein